MISKPLILKYYLGEINDEKCIKCKGEKNGAAAHEITLWNIGLFLIFY